MCATVCVGGFESVPGEMSLALGMELSNFFEVLGGFYNLSALSAEFLAVDFTELR